MNEVNYGKGRYLSVIWEFSKKIGRDYVSLKGLKQKHIKLEGTQKNITDKYREPVNIAILMMLTLIVFGNWIAVAMAADVYVPGNYPTVQAAIDNASGGDTIIVSSGTYYENVNVNKQLILRGIDTGDGIPVVDAGGTGSAITLSTDGIELEGFMATNAGSSQNAGIKVTSNNNIIKNNNASNNGDNGIYLYSSRNNTLNGNNASNNENGIYLYLSDYNTLSGNNASNNYNGGIYLFAYSDFNTLSGNNASNNGYGIRLYSDSNYNTLSGNNASNNEYGIYLDSSRSNILTNNRMINNRYNFHLSIPSNQIYFNNQIELNNLVDGKPIYYIKGASNTIYDSHINAGTFYCINCINVTIKDLNFDSNYVGIFLWNTSHSKIQNVSASNNEYGIRLNSFSGYNTLSKINASNNEYGIHLSYWSQYNTLNDNNALNNLYDGIYLGSSINYNTLSGNNASNNGNNGIYLYSSSNNTLNGNNASNNEYGIRMYSSSNNMLTNNRMINNKYNFHLSGLSSSYFNNQIELSNLVDEKPIYYIKGASNTIYDSDTNAGILYCINCINVTIKDLNFDSNYVGIFLWNTSHSKIQNINASNNEYGIRLYYCNYNTLSDNNALNNHRDGIGLPYSSNYNTLSGNNALNNEYGIHLESSSNNTLSANTASNNGYGIRLKYSSNNLLSGNNASNNNYVGIWLYTSNEYNTLSGNIASDNNNGIYLSSSSNYNTLSGNNASNNRNGIYSSSSNYNTLSGNNASNNDNGILFASSSNNAIYLNNFINSNNVYSINSINIWISPQQMIYTHNGSEYVSKLGNYWSDYTGNDTNGDGIGDTAYNIDSDVDDYPLMQPLEENNGDSIPPIINIISPANGTIVNASTITVSGTASDVSGIANVTVNGILANGTTNWSANITLTEGINTITVIATDTAGNNATKTITVIYDLYDMDNTPPVILITNPINGSTINIFNNTVSGMISDSSELASAALYLNSQHVTDLTSGAFNVKVDFVPNATNNISVYAEDIYNNNNLSWSLVNVLPSSTTTTVPANNSTTVDMRDEADTLIELSTGNNSAIITINVTASTNASDISAMEATPSYGLAPGQHSLGRYIQVNVTGDRANLTRVNLSMYYTESDLDIDGDGAADLNASTLTMYWYDANNTMWMPLVTGVNYSSIGGPVVFGSGHNSTGQYIWADLNHFSSFTLAANISRSEHICNLQSGWNMVSVPVMPIGGANVNDVFGSNVTTVFGWTGTRYQQIGLVDELVPKEAYWMLSNTGYDQPITGTPLADISHTLLAGWNMVGPVSGGVSVDSLSNVTTVFGWTGTRYIQITGTMELEPTKGYWMLAGQDTVIWI